MKRGRTSSGVSAGEIADLFRLAAPVALSRASVMLMSLTDAIVLARYAPDELPYVLNGFLPLSVAMGFGIGLMLGVQVLTAELGGAGQSGESGRIFRRGVLLALLYGVAGAWLCHVIAEPLLGLIGFDPALTRATAACTTILALGLPGHMLSIAASFYLEALRRPNIVTFISLGGVLINLIFDLLLVPTLGAEGVAWATTGSRWLMTIALIAAVIAFTPALRPSPPPPPGEALRQSRVGLGTGLANVAEWGSFNLTFAIATLVSLDAGTVYGLSVQLLGAVFMVYLGLGSATSVRVAEAVGRSDARGVIAASRLGVGATLVLAVVMGALLIMLRDPVAAIWLNAEVSEDGARLAPQLAAMLAALALITLFDGLQAVASMALRAQGVVWIPTVIHGVAYVVLMAPLAWFLALPAGGGVWGVFAGVTAATVLAGVCQIAVLEVRLRRSRLSSAH
jgi:MATE family multidrug resistance protein